MSLNPKLRFDVFLRDKFTCQYCGRKTPNVILEVDHIHPRSQGGTDDLDNLRTSCWECNRGKGVTLLEQAMDSGTVHEDAVLLAEKEMQIAELNAMKLKVRARQDKEIEIIHNLWAENYGDSNRHFPKTMIRHALDCMSYVDVFEYLEYSINKIDHSRTSQTGSRANDCANFLCAVLRNQIKDATKGKHGSNQDD